MDASCDCRDWPGGLSFAHLNLRQNPFGELSRQERPALAVVDVEDVVERLNSPGYAAQFVGPKGSGKTTHLLAIQDKFPHAGYVHIPEGERRPIPDGCPLIVDEAQRLTRLQRFRLFGQRVPLVLGTHEDFERALRRAGRDVETLSVAGRVNPDRLHVLINLRIAWFRRGPGPVPRVSLATAEVLLTRCGSDLRAVEGLLYDRFQEMREVGNVEV